MIEVDLPDGSIAEFPDGTPPEVIKGALQKKFGAPQQPQSPEMTQGLAEMSAMTQNPARAKFDALPTWQKPIVAASDMLQLGANGVTMGFGDKAVAGARSMFTDKSYDEELTAQRGLTQGARNRAGNAGTLAEVAGAVSTPLALAGKGLTLAGRGGTAAMTGAKGLAARTGLMGAEGAGYGAATAAGNDQDIGTGAAIGLAGGVGGNVVGEGLSAGLGKAAGLFNKKPPRMDVPGLKEAAKASYKRAEDAGVMFNQNGVNRLRTNVIDDLTKRGFDPANEPGVMPVIKRLEAMGQGNVTFEGLDTLRKVAANGWRPGLKSNNDAIGDIIGRIDELIDAADPSTVLMGKNPKAAAQAIKNARMYWHSGRKLETVDNLLKKGEIIGGSQKNQDVAGASKRQLRTILTSETKGRGFTAAEKAAAEKAVMGSGTQRALDAASGMMPLGRLSGLAQGSLAAANLATGNLLGLGAQGASMVAGYGAHRAAQALAQKSIDEFVDLVARGGVPAPVVQNAFQLLAKSKREAISRALMAISVHQGNARGNAPGHQAQR